MRVDFKYPKGCRTVERANLFSVVPEDRVELMDRNRKEAAFGKSLGEMA